MGIYDEPRLNTCFYVTASLNCTIDQLRVKLKLENLKILPDGKILKYEMYYSDSKDVSLLEFSDKHISLIFFFDKPSHYLYNRNLIAFLSLIISLKDSYTVNFDNLYSYIIEGLNKNWNNISKDQNQIIEGLKTQTKMLAESNCELSYQLVKCFAENKTISKELDLYREFSKEVIAKLKTSKNTSENWDILESIGTNPDLVKLTEEALMR